MCLHAHTTRQTWRNIGKIKLSRLTITIHKSFHTRHIPSLWGMHITTDHTKGRGNQCDTGTLPLYGISYIIIQKEHSKMCKVGKIELLQEPPFIPPYSTDMFPTHNSLLLPRWRVYTVCIPPHVHVSPNHMKTIWLLTSWISEAIKQMFNSAVCRGHSIFSEQGKVHLQDGGAPYLKIHN